MIKLLDKDSAIEAIQKLGVNDLRFLNSLIVERLKILYQMKSSIQMSSFSIGDKVNFQVSAGCVKRGIIHRLNKKTVTIITEDNHQWNVAPGLLRHTN
jgi:hypothetical protein